MTQERKILLILLVFTSFLFLVWVGILPVVKENRELKKKISQSSDLIAKLENKFSTEKEDPSLEEAYADLYSRFSGDRDLLVFGQEVKEEILRLSLTLEKYQQGITSGKEFLEYYMAGDVSSFIKLLEYLYGNYPFFEILSLTINTGKEVPEYSFRIFPVVLHESLRQPEKSSLREPVEFRIYPQSSAALSGIFYRPPRPVISRSAAPPAKVHETPTAPDTERLHFIGLVESAEDGLKYYFKDSKTGQLLKLSLQEDYQGWRLLEKKDRTYLITKENQLFEVNQ